MFWLPVSGLVEVNCGTVFVSFLNSEILIKFNRAVMELGASTCITHAFAESPEVGRVVVWFARSMLLKIGLMSSPLPKNIVDCYLCCVCTSTSRWRSPESSSVQFIATSGWISS